MVSGGNTLDHSTIDVKCFVIEGVTRRRRSIGVVSGTGLGVVCESVCVCVCVCNRQ